MARPSKGERMMITLRLPVAILARVDADRGNQDRHSAIVDHIAYAVEKRRKPPPVNPDPDAGAAAHLERIVDGSGFRIPLRRPDAIGGPVDKRL